MSSWIDYIIHSLLNKFVFCIMHYLVQCLCSVWTLGLGYLAKIDFEKIIIIIITGNRKVCYYLFVI